MRKKLALLGTVAIVTVIALSPISVMAANTMRTTLLAECDLKAEGWSGARTIAHMNANEGITFYPQKFGSDTEYNYMIRDYKKMKGYVDHNFVKY